MADKDQDALKVDGVGLDVHGPEPVTHQFTIYDDDGNADIEFNLSFALTPKRHEQLVHMMEEGYSQHDAYVLLAGGEILAHIQDKKKAGDGTS